VMGSCSTSCPVNGNLVSVAMAAQTLQQHVFGPRANQYDAQDPVIQQVLPYWENTCSSGGQLCPEAQSGDLQCVEFVTGAFFLGGDPLPGVANAEDLWTLYQQRAGWSEIPATAYPPSSRGLPSPGDMMVWRGGGHLEGGQYVEYGHVAVVIAISPPTVTNSGFITVAQGNAPGNRWDVSHASDPGNWYTMPILPDLSVPTWGAFTDSQGVHYDGYTMLGYIRQNGSEEITPTTPVLDLVDEAMPTSMPTATVVVSSVIGPLAQGAMAQPHLSSQLVQQRREEKTSGDLCREAACSQANQSLPVINRSAATSRHEVGERDQQKQDGSDPPRPLRIVLHPARLIAQSAQLIRRPLPATSWSPRRR